MSERKAHPNLKTLKKKKKEKTIDLDRAQGRNLKVHVSRRDKHDLNGWVGASVT